jgi:hypothetical protein
MSVIPRYHIAIPYILGHIDVYIYIHLKLVGPKTT